VENLKKLFGVALFTCAMQLHAISLVYNLKIRRSFAAGHGIAAIAADHDKEGIWLVTALPIAYWRSREIVEDTTKTDVLDKRITVGSVFNLRYVYKQALWLEATTAVETERAALRGTTNADICRTGFDDLVLSGGYNMFPTENSQLVVYLIGGFPLYNKLTALETFDTLVGTRFCSIGAGSEFSYSFVRTDEQSFNGIMQVRFIHFFNRNWFPILPKNATLQPGNITDLLLACQYRKKHTMLEVGYDITFFTNQAALSTEVVKTNAFARNSCYVSINHLCKKFPVIPTPVVVGAGLNIGRLNRFDTKITIAWLNFTTFF